jgi:hypothetical protein
MKGIRRHIINLFLNRCFFSIPEDLEKNTYLWLRINGYNDIGYTLIAKLFISIGMTNVNMDVFDLYLGDIEIENLKGRKLQEIFLYSLARLIHYYLPVWKFILWLLNLNKKYDFLDTQIVK